MPTFLGLDIGATTARWIVLDEDQRQVRSGEESSAGTAADPEGASEQLGALLERIHAACLADLPVVGVAGISGWSSPRLRASLAEHGRGAIPLAFLGDPEVAAAAALSGGPGVAVWSGTGSFAVARDQVGRLFRVGGRGPVLGDEGSATVMVLRAARQVVRAADRLAEATALTAALVDQFHAASAEQLGRAVEQRPRAEVAAALPLVVAAAVEGDAAAIRLLDEGAAALVELAVAAARRGALSPARSPLLLGGGVLEGSEEIASRVVDRARACGFAEVGLRAHGGAHGAALLARATHLEIEPLCSWVRDAPA